MKTILITGGAGYIGSHTCNILLENDFEIIVLDSLINSSISVIDNLKELLKKKISNIDEKLKFIKGDIRDKFFLEDIFKEFNSNDNKINAVIHFAGLKSVLNSINYPLDYWGVNIKGVINLLEIMDKYHCRNLIFSSSATIYSQENEMPLKENCSLSPINPYGKTKFTAESILEDLFKSNKDKWRICNLRYFNPIGAHPSGIIGENPVGIPNNIFPLILQTALKQKNKFQIFGGDWNTPDGTCIRDYIHIMDLAEGHMLALNYLLNNDPQLINFNLGTGKGTSVLSLINTFEEVNKINIPYEFAQRRRGDLPIVIADNKKAKDFLNWIPKKDIREMCKDGWKWSIQNPNGY